MHIFRWFRRFLCWAPALFYRWSDCCLRHTAKNLCLKVAFLHIYTLDMTLDTHFSSVYLLLTSYVWTYYYRFENKWKQDILESLHDAFFFFRMLPSVYRPRIIDITKAFLFVMSTYNTDFYNLIVVGHTSIPIFVILKATDASCPTFM
jgi:hypothetical protein